MLSRADWISRLAKVEPKFNSPAASLTVRLTISFSKPVMPAMRRDPSSRQDTPASSTSERPVKSARVSMKSPRVVSVPAVSAAEFSTPPTRAENSSSRPDMLNGLSIPPRDSPSALKRFRKRSLSSAASKSRVICPPVSAPDPASMVSGKTKISSTQSLPSASRLRPSSGRSPPGIRMRPFSTRTSDAGKDGSTDLIAVPIQEARSS